MIDAASLAPYLLVIFAAALPSEIWRIAAVFLSRGLSPADERIVWVRHVASALLTCVVAKLLIVPTGALTHVPIGIRLLAFAAGIGASLLARRSVFVAILVGDAILLVGGWFFAG